jgi:hypothetical protein
MVACKYTATARRSQLKAYEIAIGGAREDEITAQ